MSNNDDDDKMKDFEMSLESGKATDSTMKILNSLTDRERELFCARYEIDLDVEQKSGEVRKQLKITRDRIREIEEKAIKKLRGRNHNDDGPDAA